jgi:hypothetical protein
MVLFALSLAVAEFVPVFVLDHHNKSMSVIHHVTSVPITIMHE